MVDSVSSFNPLAYLSQIEGLTQPDTATPGDSPASSDTTSSTSPTTPTNGTTPSASALGISSDVLSLLQDVTSSSQNGNELSTLLGQGGNGVSSGTFLSGVYNTLLYQDSSTQPLTDAVDAAVQQRQDTAATTANPVQNLITSFNAASNAYNQTAIQNAQSVLDANNGQLPSA